jgi:hypothetical protein
MNDVVITAPGEYQTRSGRRTIIVEPLRSGAARGIFDEDQVYVWDEAGKCISGERELDIIGPYPTAS